VRLSSRLAERQDAKRTPGHVLPRVKEMMLAEHAAGSDRRWDIIHPSELSHQDTFCPRAVYLRLTEGPLPPGTFDWGRQNIFDEGHSIHAKWQDRLRKSVPLWGSWRCILCHDTVRNTIEPPFTGGGCISMTGHMWEYKEIGLDAVDDVMMYGHADGGFDNILVELKSVGEGTVRIEDPERHKEAGGDLRELWRGITRPFKTHLNQIDIYLWISQLNGFPFDKASFIYESKWNQQVKEFTVDYDEARSLKLVDQARAIKYSVDEKQEPACRFPGECDNCEPYDLRRATLAGSNRCMEQDRCHSG
jgi:CRISPR/Cas system-associated exonuclease Cas4 (RecB family)